MASLANGRANSRLAPIIKLILQYEHVLQASFRWAYIPTNLNTLADKASRGGKVCSAPSYVMRKEVWTPLVDSYITVVICSD